MKIDEAIARGYVRKMGGLSKMRTLFAKFSSVGEFEGWMIAKLSFKRLSTEGGSVPTEENKAAILRQKARYAIFQAEDANWQIQMHLIKPKEQKKEMDSKSEQPKSLDKKLHFEKQIAKWQITKNEILEFVTSVEDSNSIHRTEHAVVPGFLFVEKLWKDVKVAECIRKWDEYEVIFYSPTYGEETITLFQEEKTGSIFAVTRRDTKVILLWECKVL